MLNLQEFIEEKKINKVELSRLIGISRATLDLWLKGRKPEHLSRIAQGINQLAQSLFIADDTIKDINIESPTTQSYTVHDESFQKKTEGEGMHGNFIGEPKEINYNGITSATLERVIKPYENLIEMLKLQLAEKEKRIRELEEQLTNKKRGVP